MTTFKQLYLSYSHYNPTIPFFSQSTVFNHKKKKKEGCVKSYHKTFNKYYHYSNLYSLRKYHPSNFLSPFEDKC